METTTELARGCHGYTLSQVVRLFRNNEQIRFKGRVHEQVEIDLLSQNKVIINTDIPIHHYGKVVDPDYLRQKHELYLLAECLFKQDKYPEAEEILAEIISRYPDHQEAGELKNKIREKQQEENDRITAQYSTYNP